jgi:LacI family transcriptional regulator
MQSVNLKRLAEELQLSIATVSRALQDSHEVSTATKERVRALATALNYQPNAYASSLRRNQSKTIGVVIPKVTNHFFALAINGIEEAARQAGYHVLIYLTHEEYEREVSIIQHLKGGRVDGILMSVASGTADMAHLQSLQLPVVFFDRICTEIPTANVTTNDYESGYQATEHLIEAGCRTIAHLLLSSTLSIGRHRHQGYLDALAAHGLAPSPDLTLPGTPDNDGPTGQVGRIRELLQRRPDIDGIFASVERLAVSAYHVCHELGRRIPEDVKIVGFSNLESVSLFDPPLTTITQPAYDIGREAAKILLRAVEKKRAISPSQSVTLASELVPRRSTGR